MALYEEALNVREVGKPEFSARCESISAEIYPVEQGVLNQVRNCSISLASRYHFICEISQEPIHELRGLKAEFLND